MNAKPGQGIRHINFGLRLKERMDQLGLECTVRRADEGRSAAQEIAEVFGRQLRPGR